MRVPSARCFSLSAAIVFIFATAPAYAIRAIFCSAFTEGLVIADITASSISSTAALSICAFTPATSSVISVFNACSALLSCVFAFLLSIALLPTDTPYPAVFAVAIAPPRMDTPKNVSTCFSTSVRSDSLLSPMNILFRTVPATSSRYSSGRPFQPPFFTMLDIPSTTALLLIFCRRDDTHLGVILFTPLPIAPPTPAICPPNCSPKFSITLAPNAFANAAPLLSPSFILREASAITPGTPVVIAIPAAPKALPAVSTAPRATLPASVFPPSRIIFFTRFPNPPFAYFLSAAFATLRASVFPAPDIGLTIISTINGIDSAVTAPALYPAPTRSAYDICVTIFIMAASSNFCSPSVSAMPFSSFSAACWIATFIPASLTPKSHICGSNTLSLMPYSTFLKKLAPASLRLACVLILSASSSNFHVAYAVFTSGLLATVLSMPASATPLTSSIARLLHVGSFAFSSAKAAAYTLLYESSASERATVRSLSAFSCSFRGLTAGNGLPFTSLSATASLVIIGIGVAADTFSSTLTLGVGSPYALYPSTALFSGVIALPGT